MFVKGNIHSAPEKVGRVVVVGLGDCVWGGGGGCVVCIEFPGRIVLGLVVHALRLFPNKTQKVVQLTCIIPTAPIA